MTKSAVRAMTGEKEGYRLIMPNNFSLNTVEEK